jgi:hypothetical protein
MTPETETGFGSGLRAQLVRKQADETEPVEATVDVPASSGAAPIEMAPVEELFRVEVPDQDPEVSALRIELEAALDREQQLRDALQHQVEAYERELAADRDLALREAEFEQRVARLETAGTEIEERELMLRIQRDQVEHERSELVATRTELVAEEARLTELATHTDSRSLELESAAQQRAQAAAHLAQQLAALSERERELKRERGAIDAHKQEAEARAASREQRARDLQLENVRREHAVAQRELAAQALSTDVEREKVRLQERAEAVAARESALDKRNDAREQMLKNGETALAAWEKRLREQSERLERERAGHGQASQEAFALLAELEQREAHVGERETALLVAETAFTERSEQVVRTEEELRLRDARAGADLEIREDRLDEREEALAERERLITNRERDLTQYVGELQGQFSDRSVA